MYPGTGIFNIGEIVLNNNNLETNGKSNTIFRCGLVSVFSGFILFTIGHCLFADWSDFANYCRTTFVFLGSGLLILAFVWTMIFTSVQTRQLTSLSATLESGDLNPVIRRSSRTSWSKLPEYESLDSTSDLPSYEIATKTVPESGT